MGAGGFLGKKEKAGSGAELEEWARGEEFIIFFSGMSDHKISLAMDAICKECDEEECMERLIGEREHLIAIADEFNKYAHPQIAPKDTVHVLLALKDAIHEQSYDARMALLQSRVAAHVWHVISQTVCPPGGEPRFKRRS